MIHFSFDTLHRPLSFPLNNKEDRVRGRVYNGNYPDALYYVTKAFGRTENYTIFNVNSST